MAKREKLGGSASAATSTSGASTSAASPSPAPAPTVVLPTAPTPAGSALTTLIYGPPKIGKSTWASHAPTPLFLATEPGLGHLSVYKIDIENWSHLLAAVASVATAPRGSLPFQTIVLDTLDAAYRMAAEHMCQGQGVEHESELDYGAGYGMITAMIHLLLGKLNGLGMPLIFTSHSKEREILGKTKVTPTLPESARRAVMGAVDVILYADCDDSDQRVMYCRPSRKYEAGDRSGRLPAVLPLSWDAFTAAMASAVQAPAPAVTPVAPTAAPASPSPPVVPGHTLRIEAWPTRDKWPPRAVRARDALLTAGCTLEHLFFMVDGAAPGAWTDDHYRAISLEYARLTAQKGAAGAA